MSSFKRLKKVRVDMAKIVRVGARGTSRRVAEKESENWTGDSYKEVQKKSKEAAKDRYVSFGRGTRRIKFSEIPETSGRPTGKGLWVSTGRGTGKRQIK